MSADATVTKKPSKQTEKDEQLQEPKNQTKKLTTGLAERMKFGTHCALTVTERTVSRLMGFYQNIFLLDKKVNSSFYKDQGFKCYSNGEYEKAVEFFLTSIEHDEDEEVEVLFYLGMAYIHLDNYEKGLQHLKEAEKSDGNDPDIIAEIGSCLVKLEHYEEAIKYYKRAIQLSDEEVSYYYMLGAAYEKSEQFPAAITMYKKSIDLEPRDPLYYHALGFVFEKMNKHDDAIACFKKAMELEKESK